MVSGKCPTHPSLRLRLESRLRLRLGLWKKWVDGFWEMPHPPLPEVRVRVTVEVMIRFVGEVGGWFLENAPTTFP